jgi:hypothetical protein
MEEGMEEGQLNNSSDDEPAGQQQQHAPAGGQQQQHAPAGGQQQQHAPAGGAAHVEVYREVSSTRKEPLLESNGYTYCYDKDCGAFGQYPGMEFWRCVIKAPYCPGRLAVNAHWEQEPNGQRYRIGSFTGKNHTHAPDPNITAVSDNYYIIRK